MKRFSLTLATCMIAVFGLVACATPPTISANPVTTAANAIGSLPIGGQPIGGTVIAGLQNAAFNLDMATSIGVLPKTDPAAGCVHQALQAIGQDVALNSAGGEVPVGGMSAPPSFTTKVSDLLSAGSVAYILAAQAKLLAASGGLSVPPSCEQLVGEFVIKGVNAPASATISAVLNALP